MPFEPPFLTECPRCQAQFTDVPPDADCPRCWQVDSEVAELRTSTTRGFAVQVIGQVQPDGQFSIHVQDGEVPWPVVAQVLHVAYRIAERKAVEAELRQQQAATRWPLMSTDIDPHELLARLKNGGTI